MLLVCVIAYLVPGISLAQDPAPTPKPEPTPAPAPAEPAPAPAPAPAEPAPAQPSAPEPTPEPAPTPTPAPAEPTPEPTPAPNPEPAPEPSPAEPTPAPVPEPTPVPAPAEPAQAQAQAQAPTSAESAQVPTTLNAIVLAPVIIWHTNSVFHTATPDKVTLGASVGNPEACYELGLRRYASTQKKKELQAAIAFIEQAAKAGYPEAQLWVAEHYESGKNFPRNSRQAYLWCKLAADQGQPRAQYVLSLLYKAGRGVEPDSTQSAYWCKTSADNQYPPAMTRLGKLYQEGVGVPQNGREAIRWFLRGAFHNDSEAQYCLGTCYEKGYSVRANSVEAYKWLNISAAQGNAQALNTRQKVIKNLSAAQILEGQKLSQQFVEYLLKTDDPTIVDPLAATLPVENTISGFFITEDGHILTSWAPLAESSAIYVRTAFGYFKANVVLKDVHNNLALLKIDNLIKSVLSVNSPLSKDQPLPTIGPVIKPLALAFNANYSLGDPIFTVGFPAYDRLSWEPKLSEGNLKEQAGLGGDPRFLKLDILINSHYTGAPIITATGEVIGVMDIESYDNGALASGTFDSDNSVYRNMLRMQYAAPLFETLPEVKNKLKALPQIKEQKFDTSVAEAIEAVVQIIIY